MKIVADSEEILYSIALRACPLVGDVNFMKLVSVTGSAKETWKLSKSILQEISGIGTQISKGIGDDTFLKFAEKELLFCEKNNIKVRLRHQSELPRLLLECPDAPAVLYQYEEGFFIEFENPQSAIAEGQFAAWYQDEELLGSGVIS